MKEILWVALGVTGVAFTACMSWLLAITGRKPARKPQRDPPAPPAPEPEPERPIPPPPEPLTRREFERELARIRRIQNKGARLQALVELYNRRTE
jgi:hypothetical protein